MEVVKYAHYGSVVATVLAALMTVLGEYELMEVAILTGLWAILTKE